MPEIKGIRPPKQQLLGMKTAQRSEFYKMIALLLYCTWPVMTSCSGIEL